MGSLFRSKRSLVLEIEDHGVSSDPLYAYLQRRGWQTGRVKELQESMAAKSTPNLFSGEVEPLSPSEAELSAAIQEYLTLHKGAI